MTNTRTITAAASFIVRRHLRFFSIIASQSVPKQTTTFLIGPYPRCMYIKIGRKADIRMRLAARTPQTGPH
jgi:hypothetical protein